MGYGRTTEGDPRGIHGIERGHMECVSSVGKPTGSAADRAMIGRCYAGHCHSLTCGLRSFGVARAVAPPVP